MTRFLVPIIAIILLLGIVYTLVKDQINRPQRISTPQTQQTQITQESSKKTKIKIFLVALEDNGQSGKLIGCNDSIVPVEREISSTRAVLTAALEELLALNEQYYGQSGLYNALYQSNLKIENITFDEKLAQDDTAVIRLSGDYKFKGVCEDARLISQIEQTTLQFPNIKYAQIYINGQNVNNLYKGS